jgi:putative chitinase
MKALELATKYKTLLDNYQINTPLRLAHFFAQIHHESNGFTQLKENLNYSVSGLLKTFGRHRITEGQAKQFGRLKNRPANQEALANILYGGEFGRKNLGNINPGDGFKFIGRGFKQVTGRGNYTVLSKDVRIDYINNPDWLLREPDAMISACWFWQKNKCNIQADNDNVVALTRIINGGANGLPQRRDLVKTYKTIFK